MGTIIILRLPCFFLSFLLVPLTTFFLSSITFVFFLLIPYWLSSKIKWNICIQNFYRRGRLLLIISSLCVYNGSFSWIKRSIIGNRTIRIVVDYRVWPWWIQGKGAISLFQLLGFYHKPINDIRPNGFRVWNDFKYFTALHFFFVWLTRSTNDSSIVMTKIRSGYVLYAPTKLYLFWQIFGSPATGVLFSKFLTIFFFFCARTGFISFLYYSDTVK